MSFARIDVTTNILFDISITRVIFFLLWKTECPFLYNLKEKYHTAKCLENLANLSPPMSCIVIVTTIQGLKLKLTLNDEKTEKRLRKCRRYRNFSSQARHLQNIKLICYARQRHARSLEQNSLSSGETWSTFFSKLKNNLKSIRQKINVVYHQ